MLARGDAKGEATMNYRDQCSRSRCCGHRRAPFSTEGARNTLGANAGRDLRHVSSIESRFKASMIHEGRKRSQSRSVAIEGPISGASQIRCRCRQRQRQRHDGAATFGFSSLPGPASRSVPVSIESDHGRQGDYKRSTDRPVITCSPQLTTTTTTTTTSTTRQHVLIHQPLPALGPRHGNCYQLLSSCRLRSHPLRVPPD